MFFLRAKMRRCCQVCLEWAHPMDKRCNVQPRAAQNGCCAWHLGPLSLSRNWRGAGSFSKSQVLFYLSESTSDLSRRMQQRDLPHRVVFLLPCPHILPNTSLWRIRLRAISQVCFQNVTKVNLRWTFTICLAVRQPGSLGFEIRHGCFPSRSALWLLGGRFTWWQEMQPVSAHDISWSDWCYWIMRIISKQFCI